MPAPEQLRKAPGRRPRLPDAETERRMLTAGVEHVGRHGLSLSLEHLSMEDLIREAGVSRTSSYRRWPTKDAFAADLLLHLAEHTRLSADFAPYATAVRTAITPDLVAGVTSAQGRQEVLVAFFRALTAADFTASLASPAWRSYLALRAAHEGLPEGELRTRVAAALRATERGFTDYRAGALAAAAQVMGLKLRTPEVFDWRTLAEALSATFTGMLVRALADPDAVLAERMCAPFGSEVPAPWCLATLASGQVFFGATELDPDVIWDAARLTRVRAQLADLDGTLAVLWADQTGVENS